MSCSFPRSFLNLIASAQRTSFYIQRNSRLSDIIVYPGYQTFFSRAAGIFGVVRAGHYKDLTETGNRAWKVSGTQGNNCFALSKFFEGKLKTGLCSIGKQDTELFLLALTSLEPLIW